MPHVSHAGWLRLVKVFVSIIRALRVDSDSGVSFQDSSCFSRPRWFRPQESLKPSKHFRRAGHLSERLRGPSAALCRRIWRYLCWSLWEPERALRLLTRDSAVRKIRQRWFCRVEKNSKRCSCFQQNSKKTTENKCHGEREDGRQKKNQFGSVWQSTSLFLQFQMEEKLQYSDCLQIHDKEGFGVTNWPRLSDEAAVGR